MAVAGSCYTLILPELLAYAGLHGAKHPPSTDVMNISPLEVLLEFEAC
jgi:hypothetical protein